MYTRIFSEPFFGVSEWEPSQNPTETEVSTNVLVAGDEKREMRWKKILVREAVELC